MVKSCGVADFEDCDEYDVIFPCWLEPHPPNVHTPAKIAANPTARIFGNRRLMFMAGSLCPLPREAVRAPISKPQATVCSRVVWRDSCAPRPKNPAGWRRRADMRTR